MVWEDQGLYFTLILNSIAVTVMIIVGYVIHKNTEGNGRILRPNRVGSVMGTLYSFPSQLFKSDEDEVAKSRGIETAIYVIFLKYQCLMFVGCLLGMIVIVSICATDDYINVLAASTDPQDCRIEPLATCEDTPFCEIKGGVVCDVKYRTGLFQFSAQNLTPKSWRLWLYSIAVLLTSIQIGIAIIALVKALVPLLRRSYIARLREDSKYSAYASIGARTVLVMGYDGEEDECIQSPEALHASLAAEQIPDKKNKEQKVENPVAAFADLIDQKSIVVIREPPKDMLPLIDQYKAQLETLKDDVAAERNEEDEEKKPLKKRVPPGCCTAHPAIEYDEKELEKTVEELQPLIDDVPNQKLIGSAVFALDTPHNARLFIDTYNETHKGTGHVASLAGNCDGVIWSNMAVSGAAANGRWVVMMIIFVILCFFWGIPVAFLGSLENLASLPGIGPVFAGFINAIPVTVRGTLSAYLPTIVITVFNILLPVIIRIFARIGGVRTMNAEDATVLWLYFMFVLMSGIIIQAAIQGGLGQLATLISSPSKDSAFAFVMAIVSPSGGYWYAFLITAGCLGTFLKSLLLAPLILSKILGKLAGRQEAYDRLFDPRVTDFPVATATHLFFFAIGMLFHGTVPFLTPFAAIYFLNNYLVERSLALDGGATKSLISIDYSMVKAHLSIILMLHTVASIGNVIVCVMKESWGAVVFAALGLAVNIAVHVYSRHLLTPVIQLTTEEVATLQAELDTAVQPFDDLEHGFVPEYAYFKIDPDAVKKIHAEEYTIDRTWPKPGSDDQDKNAPKAQSPLVAGTPESEKTDDTAADMDKKENVDSKDNKEVADNEPISGRDSPVKNE